MKVANKGIKTKMFSVLVQFYGETFYSVFVHKVKVEKTNP